MELRAVADASVSEANPSTNYGSGSGNSLVVGHSGGRWQFYVRWDLSSIPAGSTVNSVTVRFRRFCSSNTASNLPTTLNGVASSWAENTVTWSNRPPISLIPQLQYIVPGCTTSTPWIDFEDGSAALRQWAQGIVNGGANNGLCFTSNSSSAYHVYLNRESTGGGGDNAPRLIVDFTPPVQPADLSVTSVSIPGGLVLQRGQSVAATICVRNVSGSASGTYQLNTYLSRDPIFGGAADYLVGPTQGPFASLAANQQRCTGTINVPIPDSSLIVPGTWYVLARFATPPDNNPANDWNASASFEIIVAPDAPPNPSVSYQCGSAVLVASGSPPAGTTWYWQGTQCGTSTQLSAASAYTATSSGTYYIRARHDASGTWSGGCGSAGVAIPAIPDAPPAPVVLSTACGRATLGIQGTPPPGVLWYWQGLTCGTDSSNAAPTVVVTASGTYRIRARGTSQGCWSSGCSSVLVEVPAGSPADWNQDGAVNSQDINAFLGAWLQSIADGSLAGDFNGDGAVNSIDISAFLTAWLTGVGMGC